MGLFQSVNKLEEIDEAYEFIEHGQKLAELP